MSSACVFKDNFRKETQGSLFFEISFLHLGYKLSASIHTYSYLKAFIISHTAATSKVLPVSESLPTSHVLPLSLFQVIFLESVFSIYIPSFRKKTNIDFFDSIDSGVNHWWTLFSRELSGAIEIVIITFWSVAFPETQTVSLRPKANHPTSPYGYGRQDPMFASSWNNWNLPPNFFNILATTAVVPPRVGKHKDWESPLSPLPSDITSIWTRPMTINTFDIWETCGYLVPRDGECRTISAKSKGKWYWKEGTSLGGLGVNWHWMNNENYVLSIY